MIVRTLSFFLLVLVVVGYGGQVVSQSMQRPVAIAVLDFGDSHIGRSTADRVIAMLKSNQEFSVIDRDATRFAAKGAGYNGSLNLSLKEARDLGDAIGCAFYFIGDAQTLRRSLSSKPIYFESYASIFLVSSRSGKLVLWERPSFEADTAASTERSLLESLSGNDFSSRYKAAIQKASADERQQRESELSGTDPIIEAVPDDEKAAEASGLRMPRPYRRLRPKYPETAARADAEAVVDVLVDLDAAGEVGNIEVARWAGFGLDEATIETVRQLHFFPAMRDGRPVPIRVLLRYNFHKPSP